MCRTLPNLNELTGPTLKVPMLGELKVTATVVMGTKGRRRPGERRRSPHGQARRTRPRDHERAAAARRRERRRESRKSPPRYPTRTWRIGSGRGPTC